MTIRTAVAEDRAQLVALMARAIDALLQPYLSPAQIEASRAVMGLDSQLIADGTYFVVEEAGRILGCGGWSRRATLYGGDHSARRDAALLDPARDPARIRAMYTDPAAVRRGVGRLILREAERAARACGFKRAELIATLAGLPLYAACGYAVRERFDEGGVPMIRMDKTLSDQDGSTTRT